MPLFRAAAEDFFDVGPEADIEHAIGFVEHDDLDGAQIECSAANQVDHAAGCADDDIGPAFELGDLAANRFAAIDRHAGHPPAVGEFFEFFADLHGQLARGHEHERAWRAGFPAVLQTVR